MPLAGHMASAIYASFIPSPSTTIPTIIVAFRCIRLIMTKEVIDQVGVSATNGIDQFNGMVSHMTRTVRQTVDSHTEIAINVIIAKVVWANH